VVLLIVTVSGCAHYMDHGTVVDKNYRPGYSTFVYCGKGCFVPVYNPPKWVLQLRSGDEIGIHEVSSGQYDRYQIGDPYP